MKFKRTRARRKHSSLIFDMAVLDVRQSNLAMMIYDALMRMQFQIADLQKEIEKLKGERL